MQKDPCPLPFGPRNYWLLLCSIACLALGFSLIALEPAPYGFGIMGLTMGPIVVVAGFGIAFSAILCAKGK